MSANRPSGSPLEYIFSPSAQNKHTTIAVLLVYADHLSRKFLRWIFEVVVELDRSLLRGSSFHCGDGPVVRLRVEEGASPMRLPAETAIRRVIRDRAEWIMRRMARTFVET
jgi:hypothetical protein